MLFSSQDLRQLDNAIASFAQSNNLVLILHLSRHAQEVLQSESLGARLNIVHPLGEVGFLGAPNGCVETAGNALANHA